MKCPNFLDGNWSIGEGPPYGGGMPLDAVQQGLDLAHGEFSAELELSTPEGRHFILRTCRFTHMATGEPGLYSL